MFNKVTYILVLLISSFSNCYSQEYKTVEISPDYLIKRLTQLRDSTTTFSADNSIDKTNTEKFVNTKMVLDKINTIKCLYYKNKTTYCYIVEYKDTVTTETAFKNMINGEVISLFKYKMNKGIIFKHHKKIYIYRVSSKNSFDIEKVIFEFTNEKINEYISFERDKENTYYYNERIQQFE